MTAEAAASCDPDYGWINGPDGSNRCYMVLRVRIADVDRYHVLVIGSSILKLFPYRWWWIP